MTEHRQLPYDLTWDLSAHVRQNLTLYVHIKKKTTEAVNTVRELNIVSIYYFIYYLLFLLLVSEECHFLRFPVLFHSQLRPVETPILIYFACKICQHIPSPSTWFLLTYSEELRGIRAGGARHYSTTPVTGMVPKALLICGDCLRSPFAKTNMPTMHNYKPFLY